MGFKSLLKASSDFNTIEKIVNDNIDFGKNSQYVDQMSKKNATRISAHIKKNPTIWSSSRHSDWLEEVWTKAIDGYLNKNKEKDEIFLDSEVPIFNAGNVDIIIQRPSSIEIIEVKVGNETKALREAIFYSLALRNSQKLNKRIKIKCGIISVPKKNKSAHNISSVMKKKLQTQQNNFNEKLKKYNIEICRFNRAQFNKNDLPAIVIEEKVPHSDLMLKNLI